MITVADAKAKICALARGTESESVPLRRAAGRVLSQPVHAGHTQSPFDTSAMDGYAVQSASVTAGARFRVIGEAAAGHGFSGQIASTEAVRIFTGAPVPEGADRIIIQEDVTREADTITLKDTLDSSPYIRPKGHDFAEGTPFAPQHRLTPGDVTLIGAMNHATLFVRKKPRVAIIATGDELVTPGEVLGPDQIVASNGFGVAALLEAAGAETQLLPIARDTTESLEATFRLAENVDLIVTIGGASVGDHDLVAPVARSLGLDLSFYKIAMRPGKPLMAGRMGNAALVGLPGNPVSALICTRIFLLPLIDAMLRLPAAQEQITQRPLAVPLTKNGPREHYMRAKLQEDGRVVAHGRQDSSLLSVLAWADTLVIRPPHDSPREAGEPVNCIPLYR